VAVELVARPLAKAREYSEFEFRHPSKFINGQHKQRSARKKITGFLCEYEKTSLLFSLNVKNYSLISP
jgi:hypothetical protein